MILPMLLMLVGGMPTEPRPAPAASVTPAERLAYAMAAGFRVRGQSILNECDAEPEMLEFERQDLNNDHVPEVIVSDGGACYGQAGAMFAVLRQSGGSWVRVLSAQGLMTALKTQHGGWKDIEIGGPGFGKMPVARWNGTKYVY